MIQPPTDIKAKKSERQLVITWEPAHVAAYGFKYLRCHCGCASCVDERTGVRTLNSDAVSDDIMIEDISLVGNYAMQAQWSDGHSTGIYSWEYLLKICPCDRCGGSKSFGRRPSPLGTR